MFDQDTVDVPCPNGHEVPVKIRDARRRAVVRCPRCGATVSIDGRQFDRTLRDVERRFRGFGS